MNGFHLHHLGKSSSTSQTASGVLRHKSSLLHRGLARTHRQQCADSAANLVVSGRRGACIAQLAHTTHAFISKVFLTMCIL